MSFACALPYRCREIILFYTKSCGLYQSIHETVEPAFLECVHRVFFSDCVLSVLLQPIVHYVLIVKTTLDGFLQSLAVVVACIVRYNRNVANASAPYANVSSLGLYVYPSCRWSLWISVYLQPNGIIHCLPALLDNSWCHVLSLFK